MISERPRQFLLIAAAAVAISVLLNALLNAEITIPAPKTPEQLQSEAVLAIEKGKAIARQRAAAEQQRREREYQQARERARREDAATPAPQLVLQKANDGHYHAEGEIDGVPVNFLIDTGATITALPRQYRQLIPSRPCRVIYSNTANGTTTTCRFTSSTLSVGPFRIAPTEIAIIDTLNTPLLGMNVLNTFKISTENGQMRIGP